MQAQRRSKEHSRSTSALSGQADEKSEVSQDADHHLSLYSNGFMTSSIGKGLAPGDERHPQTPLGLNVCPPRFSCFSGYQHAKTVELQQRSSSVATQQTTVSSVPSHPSTTGVSSNAKVVWECELSYCCGLSNKNTEGNEEMEEEYEHQ